MSQGWQRRRSSARRTCPRQQNMSLSVSLRSSVVCSTHPIGGAHRLATFLATAKSSSTTWPLSPLGPARPRSTSAVPAELSERVLASSLAEKAREGKILQVSRRYRRLGGSDVPSFSMSFSNVKNTATGLARQHMKGVARYTQSTGAGMSPVCHFGLGCLSPVISDTGSVVVGAHPLACQYLPSTSSIIPRKACLFGGEFGGGRRKPLPRYAISLVPSSRPMGGGAVTAPGRSTGDGPCIAPVPTCAIMPAPGPATGGSDPDLEPLFLSAVRFVMRLSYVGDSNRRVKCASAVRRSTLASSDGSADGRSRYSVRSDFKSVISLVLSDERTSRRYIQASCGVSCCERGGRMSLKAGGARTNEAELGAASHF